MSGWRPAPPLPPRAPEPPLPRPSRPPGLGGRPHDLCVVVGDTVLTPPELIGQIAAELSLAVALVDLSIKDLRSAHQGVDLLLPFLLSPEPPLVAHELVLGGLGLNLGGLQRQMFHVSP